MRFSPLISRFVLLRAYCRSVHADAAIFHCHHAIILSIIATAAAHAFHATRHAITPFRRYCHAASFAIIYFALCARSSRQLLHTRLILRDLIFHCCR